MTGIGNLCNKNVAQYRCIVVLLNTMCDRDSKCFTKNFAQCSCIVAVLLGTMNERDKKNVHQRCG